MRLEFRQTPWDLVCLIGYAVLVYAVFLATQLSALLGLLLLLFPPGYVLFAVLFPRDGDFDWIQRICLSFGLGILTAASLGIVLSITSWDAGPASTMLATVAFDIVLGFAAVVRRLRVPPESRLGLSANLSASSWSAYKARDKVLTGALGAILVVAAVTLGYLLLAPAPAGGFTDFYVLCSDGKTNPGCYPSRLNISQPGTIILGLANHEAVVMNYTIRVDLVGVRVVFNSTSGQNETTEINRTVLSWYNLTVPDEHNVSQQYSFTIASAGYWKLQFLLYKNDFLTIEELHLFITVS